MHHSSISRTLLVTVLSIVFVTSTGCSPAAFNPSAYDSTWGAVSAAWEEAKAIKYVKEPAGQDYWQPPRVTLVLGTGDCEDKAILLWYRLKYCLKLKKVRLVVGQIHPIFLGGGHAWVEVGDGLTCLIMDPTQKEMQPRYMLSDLAYQRLP